MTQTATFPDLESLPDVATQAFLYFSPTIGTLTEVDMVASGSYSTQFRAENLGHTASTIVETTSGNLSINVPSGPIAVTIPSVTERFKAAPYDGALNYGGSSGKDFAPETASSAPQTKVLTSPADLATFTGAFRIPVSVTGHATGSATATNDYMSSGFTTKTSVTLTIIYRYIPILPNLEPPATTPSSQSPGASGAGNATVASLGPASSATSAASATPTGSAGLMQSLSTPTHHSTIHARNKKPLVAGKWSHNPSHHHGRRSLTEIKWSRSTLRLSQ
jgi:hypothetical protein